MPVVFVTDGPPRRRLLDPAEKHPFGEKASRILGGEYEGVAPVLETDGFRVVDGIEVDVSCILVLVERMLEPVDDELDTAAKAVLVKDDGVLDGTSVELVEGELVVPAKLVVKVDDRVLDDRIFELEDDEIEMAARVVLVDNDGVLDDRPFEMEEDELDIPASAVLVVDDGVLED